MDARSGGRFNGTEPEPRPGLRPGHIPGAVNVPFDTLLMHSGAMRKLDDLRGMFASARIDLSSPITGAWCFVQCSDWPPVAYRQGLGT